MSDMLLSKDGIDPRVTTLAEQIKAAQAPEIEQLQAWLTSWGQEFVLLWHEYADHLPQHGRHDTLYQHEHADALREHGDDAGNDGGDDVRR